MHTVFFVQRDGKMISKLVGPGSVIKVADLENAKPGLEIGRVLRVTQMLGLQLSVAPRVWPEAE